MNLMDSTSQDRPSVPGSPKTPGYGSNWKRQRTEGAKNPQVRSGYQRRRQMHISTYNTRTISSDEKLIELEEELSHTNWDVLGLSEVRRKGEQHIYLKSGNLFYHRGEEEGSLRGVGFLVNRKLVDKVVDIGSINSRVAFLVLQISKRYQLKIIQAYAPTSEHPDEEVEGFYEDVERAMNCSQTQYLLLMGDFNAKLGCKEELTETPMGKFGYGHRNERGRKLLEFLLKNGLFAMNTYFKKKQNRKWTWKSPDGNTKNEIDYIITNKRRIVQDVETLNRVSIGSDHRMLRAKVMIDPKQERSRLVRKESNTKKWTSLRKPETYSRMIEEGLKEIENLTLEDLNNRLVRVVQEAMDKCLPKQKTKIDKLSYVTKNLMKRRRDMINKNTEEYRNLCREISKSVRKDVRQYNKNLIEQVIEQNKSLKIMRQQLGTGHMGIHKLKNDNGDEVTNKEQLLQITETFFEQLYKCATDPVGRPQVPKVLNVGSEEIPDITRDEITAALSDMKNNKSPGEDNITLEAIKEGGEPIIKALQCLFNKCLIEGATPSAWNNGTIVLFHKKGDTTNLTNYRPISLLCHMFKLFTRILTKRLSSKFEMYQPREQAGFRSGFGTNDHLLAIKLLIQKSVEYNKPLVLVFVDYEKAFDSIDQHKLLESLVDCRIDFRYTALIKYIYDNATASVRLHQNTNKFKIQKGVRQGDTVSPKLFITLLEYAFKKLDWRNMGVNIDGEYLNHLRFADDIVLIADNIEEASKMLNSLQAVSNEVGLKINFSKTQFMTNLVLSRPISVGDKHIYEVSTYKYLGHEIQLGKDNQTHELQRRVGLAWAAFGKLRHVFRSNIPICLKKKVFDQCVLPVLTYGSETLTLTKKTVNKIQVAQRAMERSMLGLTLRDKIPNVIIRQRTRVTDAIYRITCLKWNWAGHVARMTDNRWTKRLVEWRPRREAFRNRGRPYARWTDDIKRISANWIQAAQDRDGWKRLREAYIQQWMQTAA